MRQPGAKMRVVMNNAAHDPKMTESVLNGWHAKKNRIVSNPDWELVLVMRSADVGPDSSALACTQLY